jgi:3-dehydroquinate dehydratase/shikimate dehydrogenase
VCVCGNCTTKFEIISSLNFTMSYLYYLQLATSDLQIVDGARRSSTLICAPVMAETVDQMLIQTRKAKELGADLVEIRLDFLKNFSPRQDLEILFKQCPLPTLITYR